MRFFARVALAGLLLLTGAVGSATDETTYAADRCGRAARKLAIAEARRLHQERYRFGGPDGPIISTSENHILYDYPARLQPFYESGVPGWFSGVRGLPISYRIFEVKDPKGTVVISHGWSESKAKYAELIYNFTENGYNVYILDHRGHGESGRLTGNPRKIHVERFNDYVEDLETFMNQVVKRRDHKNVTLFGYSMGGLVSTLYASRNPKAIDRLVLVAPMLKINLRGAPSWMVQYASQFLSTLGLGSRYAPRHGDSWIRPLPLGEVSTSRQRHIMKLRRYVKERDTLSGGATLRWVAEAVGATRRLKGTVPKVEAPTLVVTGTEDQVVVGKAHRQYVKEHPNARHVEIEGGRHDLFNERDELRNQTLYQIFRFLGENEGRQSSGTADPGAVPGEASRQENSGG